MTEHLKDCAAVQKQPSHCCMKSWENDKSVGFFPNDLTSKLYKIKTIEAITKIQNSTGPLAFSL